jgi:hypothetical protein
MGDFIQRRRLRVDFGSVICIGFSASLASLSCREDDAHEAPPPTEEELDELYTELCSRHVECSGDPLGHGTVSECVDVQIEYYTSFSDACLNAVVSYHECLLDVMTCQEFMTANGPLQCRDLADDTYPLCDGGVNL